MAHESGNRMTRTIGSVTLDDLVHSYVSEIIVPSARDVQLEQIVNRQGRMTRIKEDRKPLVIDVRGYWMDGGGAYWRDFCAALLNQSRASFTLGDGTRFEWVDVTELAGQQVTAVQAWSATPSVVYAWTMKVASYEPYVREVAPTLQSLGSIPFGVGNLLTATQASFETSLSGWQTANSNTVMGLASVNRVALGSATFEADLGGWTADEFSVISHVNTHALHGSFSMAVTALSAPTEIYPASPYAYNGYPVSPGQTVTMVAYTRGDITSEPVQAIISFYDATGHLQPAFLSGNTSVDNSTGWTLNTVTGFVPPNCFYAFLQVHRHATTIGEVFYVDCAGFFYGTSIVWTVPGWLPLNGTQALGVISVAAGDVAVSTSTGTAGIPVTPGVTYTGLGSSNACQVVRSTKLSITWVNSSGTVLSTTTGSPVTNTLASWTQATVSGTAPAGAAYAYLTATVSATGGANEFHYWDAMSFAAGTSTTWQPGGYAGLGTATFSVSYPGTAFAEPTWQLALNVPSGVAVQQVELQNTTTGEACIVSGLNLYTGTWYVLFDASGGVVPASGATPPTPGNGQYGLLAVPSIGYGVTIAQVGATGSDVDFIGQVPTLVPNSAPSIPPVTMTNTIVASVWATNALSSAALSVLAPARSYR
jgi:hypothetical protein